MEKTSRCIHRLFAMYPRGFHLPVFFSVISVPTGQTVRDEDIPSDPEIPEAATADRLVSPLSSLRGLWWNTLALGHAERAPPGAHTSLRRKLVGVSRASLSSDIARRDGGVPRRR